MLTEAQRVYRRAERVLAVTMAGDLIRRWGGDTPTHEAGHALIAVLLHQPIDAVTIIPSGDTLGSVSYLPWHQDPDHPAVSIPQSPGASRAPLPAIRDRRQAIGIASLIVPASQPRWKEIRGYVRRAEFLARCLLKANWPVVIAIAERLREEKTLTGDRVHEISRAAMREARLSDIGVPGRRKTVLPLAGAPGGPRTETYGCQS